MALSIGGLRTGSTSASDYPPRDYTPEYGGIPNLPKYVTDTQTMVGTDREAEMRKNLPGYQPMTLADVSNIQANLGGRVAPDVLTLLQQQAAERGIGTGVGGAPNTDAAYLRALGLTSLQLQQLGHQQLTEAMARTPFQERQTTSMQRDLGLERAQYAAAPNPMAAAMEALRQAQAGIGAGQRGGYGGGIGGYTITPGYDRPPVTAGPSPQYTTTGYGANTSRGAQAAAAAAAQQANFQDWYSTYGPGHYGNVSNTPMGEADLTSWMGELGYGPTGMELEA